MGDWNYLITETNLNLDWARQAYTKIAHYAILVLPSTHNNLLFWKKLGQKIFLVDHEIEKEKLETILMLSEQISIWH